MYHQNVPVVFVNVNGVRWYMMTPLYVQHGFGGKDHEIHIDSLCWKHPFTVVHNGCAHGNLTLVTHFHRKTAGFWMWLQAIFQESGSFLSKTMLVSYGFLATNWLNTSSIQIVAPLPLEGISHFPVRPLPRTTVLQDCPTTRGSLAHLSTQCPI